MSELTTTIRKILDQKGDLSKKYEDGETLFHLAVYQKDTEALMLLFKNGATIDLKNDLLEETPLHLAVSLHSGLEMIKLFLDHKAKVNVKNKLGETPLYTAVDYEDLKMVKLLLKHRADASLENQSQDTPLHMAVLSNNIQIVKLLLSHGAPISPKNENQNTPLHIATFQNSLEMVRLLLSQKAQVNSKNREGKTPLCLTATKDFYKKNFELLIAYGAQKSAFFEQPKCHRLSKYFDKCKTQAEMMKEYRVFTLKQSSISLHELFCSRSASLFYLSHYMHRESWFEKMKECSEKCPIYAGYLKEIFIELRDMQCARAILIKSAKKTKDIELNSDVVDEVLNKLSRKDITHFKEAFDNPKKKPTLFKKLKTRLMKKVKCSIL